MKSLRNVKRTGRRFLGRLNDKRAARRKGACNFSRRLAHRKIPWRKRRNSPDWLMKNDVFNPGLAGNDSAIGPLAFRRIPFEELAAANNLEASLLKRLAMFECDRLCNLLNALTHQG